LNVENDLVIARNSQIEAVETFSNAVALLWKDAGVLLERKNINVNIAEPEELTVKSLVLPFPAKATSTRELAEEPSQKTTPFVAVSPTPPKFIATKKAVIATPPPKIALKKSVLQEDIPQKTVYTLSIGEYASSELASTQKKVEKAGLVPLVSAGTKQPRAVIRLRAGDYSSLLAAKTELGKLRKLHVEAFILKRDEKGYRLYAGSYFSQSSALKEQRRLVDLGMGVRLEEASVMLPTSALAAGRFPTREAALKGAQKLKKLGVEAVVERLADKA
jgi:hypothetical protein